MKLLGRLIARVNDGRWCPAGTGSVRRDHNYEVELLDEHVEDCGPDPAGRADQWTCRHVLRCTGCGRVAATCPEAACPAQGLIAPAVTTEAAVAGVDQR